jgi:hypothetical protein
MDHRRVAEQLRLLVLGAYNQLFGLELAQLVSRGFIMPASPSLADGLEGSAPIRMTGGHQGSSS